MHHRGTLQPFHLAQSQWFGRQRTRDLTGNGGKSIYLVRIVIIVIWHCLSVPVAGNNAPADRGVAKNEAAEVRLRRNTPLICLGIDAIDLCTSLRVEIGDIQCVQYLLRSEVA